ncbi:MULTISPECIES: hypothetical protein [unclassified Kitasatospora]|uniref:hypothetical protein n=1 Tax=unclassified Kitasatospora TaxID=2633591 RepID=UPI00070E89B3|nr:MULTISPECIES: hypothetical protein [unclassified Kitasatospora]KQV04429.1 hypothetical protein ASC99_13520 [Kitasatospora sp. Root107]KRB61040.1 hypothetical protein ASE03_11975 [Kitasatospora sp. Root187]
MPHPLRGLAANPALPRTLLDRLIATADTDTLVELADRPDLSHAEAVALAARDEYAAIRLAYAGLLTAADVDPVAQPSAALALLDERAGPPAWARLLATHPAMERREKLAACPDLPSDVVALLAADPEIRVVAELALWTTSEAATRLAEHPHAEVRRSVAANQAAPPAVLAMLLTGDGLPPARWCLVCDHEPVPFEHDPHCPRRDCALPPDAACDGGHQSTVHAIQQAALGNPATPPAACAAFADHPSALLRHELACRTDLSASTYARLAEDAVPWTRAALAANPAIDEALQRRLAVDDGHNVRRSLAHHPHLPLDLLTSLADTVRTGPVLLPRVAAASPGEVNELAQSPSSAVRMLVAQRRDLPAELRDALAADPDAKVVASVAPHPGLSEAQLRTALDRHGDRVAAAVAANPDAPSALLADLAHRSPPARKALREIALHRHATAPALQVCLTDPRARRTAAGHPALPPSVVAELLGDDDWQVVEAAAANPALPRALAEQLITSR